MHSPQQHGIKTGFTIVELVVVIAVIGILATIVIASYGAWREKVATSLVKNDLHAAAAAMQGARNFNDTYPLSIPSTFEATENVQVTYMSGNAYGYCVQATSTEESSVQFYIEETNTEPQPGTC
ncbi:MAG TPA: type II secretion system protein [Candidatus Saccharimonadales bacterium]|nr:type II secretion system protein [Candidatus Saccharimonadales bacterium]